MHSCLFKRVIFNWRIKYAIFFLTFTTIFTFHQIHFLPFPFMTSPPLITTYYSALCKAASLLSIHPPLIKGFPCCLRHNSAGHEGNSSQSLVIITSLFESTIQSFSFYNTRRWQSWLRWAERNLNGLICFKKTSLAQEWDCFVGERREVSRTSSFH